MQCGWCVADTLVMKIVCIHVDFFSVFFRFSPNVMEDEGIFAKLRSQPGTQCRPFTGSYHGFLLVIA